jgi:hypothetical protein
MADTGTSIAQLIGQLKTSNANLPQAMSASGGKEQGESRSIVVNVNAAPSGSQTENQAELVNQEKVINSLDRIYGVLSQQLNFSRKEDSERQMEIQTKPQDFQKQIQDSQKQMVTAIKETKQEESSGIGGLVGALMGFIPKMGGLITGIAEFAPAIATLVAAVAGFKAVSSALSWAAEKLGSGSISGGIGGFFPNAPGTGKESSGWKVPEMFKPEPSDTPRSGPMLGEPGKPGSGAIKRWDDVEYGTKQGKFQFKPEIASIIKDTAEKSGLDENYLRTMAHIESKGNPTAFNKGSKAAGLYQFIPSTAKLYGIRGNEFDPRANAMAAAKLSLDNKSSLERAGIEATPEMLYIAHQQGAQGAINLVNYAKEGRGFSQLPAKLQRNITSNVPGRKALGAEEFLDFWKSGYRQHAAVAGIPDRNQKNENEEPSLVDKGIDKLKKWTGIGDDEKDSTKSSASRESNMQNGDESYSQAYKELSSRVANKGVDLKNINADYAVNLSNFAQEAEKEFGKKLQVTSAYRPPTRKEKEALNSSGTPQESLKKGQLVASTYGSMHGSGEAADLMFEGMGTKEMNSMSKDDKQKWFDLAKKHNLNLPMLGGEYGPETGKKGSSTIEWWHLEPGDLEKRGDTGLRGGEYANKIKKDSLETAIKEDTIPKYTKAQTSQKYALSEKIVQEGEKYGEEESEEEETSEKAIREPSSASTTQQTSSPEGGSTILDIAMSKLKSEADAEGMGGFGGLASVLGGLGGNNLSSNDKMIDLLSNFTSNTKDTPTLSISKQMDDFWSPEIGYGYNSPKLSNKGSIFGDFDVSKFPMMMGADSVTEQTLSQQKSDLLSSSSLVPQGFDGRNNPFGSLGNIFSTAGTMSGGISSVMSGIAGMKGGDTRSIINSVNGMLGMGSGMMRGMGGIGGMLGSVGGMMNGSSSPGSMLGGVGRMLGSLGVNGIGGGSLGQIGGMLGSVGGMMNGGGNLGGIGGLLGSTFGGPLGGLIGRASGGAMSGLFGSVMNGGGVGDAIGGLMGGALNSTGGLGGILGSLGVTGFGGGSNQTASREGTGQYPGRGGGSSGSLDEMMNKNLGIQREEGFPTMGGMGKEEYLKRQARGETFDPKTGAGSGGRSTPIEPRSMSDIGEGVRGLGEAAKDIGSSALEGLYNIGSSVASGIGGMFGLGGGDSGVASKGIGDDIKAVKENHSGIGSTLGSLGVSGIGDALGTSSLMSEGGSMIGGALDGLQSSFSSMMGTGGSGGESSAGGGVSSGGGSSAAVGNAGGGGGSGGGSPGFKSGDQRAGSSSGAMGIQMGVRNEESILQKAQYSVIRIV